MGSAGEGAGGAGEVERDRGEDEPGAVRGEAARGQVRQGGVREVCEDLFDDRVAAVGLVGGGGVQVVGGEERVESPDVEQGRLGRVNLSVEPSGIRRTTSRPGTWSALRADANAVNAISATSAREIHVRLAASKTAFG